MDEKADPVASLYVLLGINMDQQPNLKIQDFSKCWIKFFCVSHLQKLGADFKLWRLDAGLLGSIPPVLDALKQLVNGPWDDALILQAHIHIKTRPHGVGLPWARLEDILLKKTKKKMENILTIPGSTWHFLSIHE